jgi:hypothetical protein
MAAIERFSLVVQRIHEPHTDTELAANGQCAVDRMADQQSADAAALRVHRNGQPSDTHRRHRIPEQTLAVVRLQVDIEGSLAATEAAGIEGTSVR